MPKLKVKNWKGLYTNIDPNDMSLEQAETSINWRHSRGFLEFEPRYLSEYTLPDVDTAFAGYNWEWETGIYCTLTNDPLAQNPIAAKYDILLVVAKAFDGTTYHRLIYFKDLTNNSIWYEPSKHGNVAGTMIENHNGAGGFTNSYFDTTIDAKVFFRVESGHLKIFFPHDVFWLGRLERDMNIPGRRTNAINNFYLDRLVEDFDSSDWTRVWPTLNMTPPQRIKWIGGITLAATTADTMDPQPITLGARTDVKGPGGYDILLTEAGGSDYSAVYPYTGTIDATSDLIPTTVEYAAGGLSNTFWGRLYGSAVYWPLWVGGAATILTFPAALWDYYEPFNPATGEGRDLVAENIATYQTDTHFMKFNSEGVPIGFGILANRASYTMTKANFESIKWRYKGPGLVNGFESFETSFHLVVTAVLDEREEPIISMGNFTVNQSAAWSMHFTNATVARWSNYRVTRLRYYIRLGSEEVHYLYKDVPFLPGDIEPVADFWLNPRDNTGITLAQNIGVEVEPDEMYRYKVLTSFRDFVTESGISIGLSYTDYANAYYSVLGGGNLQPDLMYSQNILPVTGANIINACAVVNIKLAVLSDDSMYIIDVVQDVGALVFTVNRALEFGVKNQFDVAQIQGGVALNTRHGIYTTTGTQSNLISEPIDNVVKKYFDTSSILYNKDIHELYYKRDGSDNLYRFRFKDQVWEVINKF